MSADGRLAVSASEDGTLKVWDLETGRELHTLQSDTRDSFGVAVSANGRQAVSASEDGTLRVWDLGTGRQVRTLEGHSDIVYDVAVNDDGRLAVSASNDRTVKLWDLESGTTAATFTCDVAALCCAFAGRRKVVAGDADGGVHFLRLEDPKPKR